VEQDQGRGWAAVASPSSRQVLAGYGFAVFELAGRDEAQVCVQGPSAPVLRVVARGFAMPRQSGPFQQLKNCGAAVSASLMRRSMISPPIQ
jgi:hypothetical protein